MNEYSTPCNPKTSRRISQRFFKAVKEKEQPKLLFLLDILSGMPRNLPHLRAEENRGFVTYKHSSDSLSDGVDFWFHFQNLPSPCAVLQDRQILRALGQ